MRVNINSLPDGYKVVNGKVIKTMALGGVPRSQANLEAEKGETALTDLDNDGVHELHTIGGNRHSGGGTPLNLPPQSFIFSDTAKMKFDKTELAELGIESTKKRTPAWVSKKHPLNKFIQGMDDEHSDSITDETSELMLHKNKLQLSKIAFMQEAKKDFIDEEGNVHVPLAAYPFLISKGVNPEEFVAKLEEINNQKKEAQSQQGQGMQPQGPPQGMPPQGMQQAPQGPPMHQMPDGQMMPGASHGAPPQGPPMMNDGGEMQQLMQEIVQALQQGAQPEQIMQQLVEMGMPEQQAMQMLQQVIQSIQGQQGQQRPPMMRSGGDVPCLSCGGSMMEYGGDPFSNNPLHQFVYGGQEPLRQYQGQNGSSEVPDTFRGKVGQESWAGVRSLWYKSYKKAIEDYNATAAGRANPIVPQDEAEAFETFYTFNEMNDLAEEQNLNYDAGCERDANGKRPNTPECKHNDPNGKDSYTRMKNNNLIGADVTADQYKNNTQQFQVMYAALADIKNNENTSESDLALLDGLPITTSSNVISGHTQHGENVSNFDGLNGGITSTSRASAIDDPGNVTVDEVRGCPDEAAKSAECAARNVGGGATTPLINPLPEGDGTPEGGPATDSPEGGPATDSPEGGPATDSPVGPDDLLDQAQAGLETGATWVWNPENCQCEQGPGDITQGTPPKMRPWVQDQNNLTGAMHLKSMEEDFWPIKRKLQYEDAGYTRNDPLTRIHGANALAGSLGENATHAQRMDLFGKAAGSNREAVQNVQEADVRGYNQFEKENAINRAKIDALNSGFASKYVDDTNLVQANRIAKDQAHDANINTQNNALLTNMANTYNQNSLYPNYNVRPDYAGAIEFANPQAIRDEQSQGSYPRIDEFAAWEAAYPNHTTDQIIDLMGKAKEKASSDGGRQRPGGYPTTPPAKYGREMRDLQANRKALRRWILGIQ